MSMTAGDLNKHLAALESRAAEEDRETNRGKVLADAAYDTEAIRLYLRRRGIKSVSLETSAIKRSFSEVDRPGLTEIHIENEDLWRGSLHGSSSDSGGLLKGMRGSMNALWGLSALRDL
jgi:hypothetical protein